MKAYLYNMFRKITFDDRLIATSEEKAEELVKQELALIDDKHRIEATREKLAYLSAVLVQRSKKND